MPERRYFNYACPLCLEVVDVKQPTCFRVLPLDLECTEIINETPEWRGFSIYHWGELAVGNIGFKPRNTLLSNMLKLIGFYIHDAWTLSGDFPYPNFIF